MLIYDDFIKKCYVVFKKFLLLFWKFLSCLVCVPSFKSINNSSSLSRKNLMGIILQGQNTLVSIGLIELTEPSDTLNYRSFFKHCILQTVLKLSCILNFFD